MIYKITFNLDSPVMMTTRPMFDSIIAFAWWRELNKRDRAQSLDFGGDLIDFSDMPITKHPDGYFLASWMMYDRSEAIRSVLNYRSRFDSSQAHRVNFGSKRRKVRTDAGKFKSFDIPYTTISVPRVWFYFHTTDVAAVVSLLNRHIYGIGKKVGTGCGRITSTELEEITTGDPFDDLIRPVPYIDMIQVARYGDAVVIQNRGWLPPYHTERTWRPCLTYSGY